MNGKKMSSKPQQGKTPMPKERKPLGDGEKREEKKVPRAF